MLKKEGIEALAKSSGLSVEVLTKAISDEKEVDIEVLVSKTFTESEWETFEGSVNTEKTAEYEKGKTAGSEMTVKEMKKDAGLEFEGKKKEDFIQHFKTKVLEDADKNPDSRVKELESDLKALREVSIPEKEAKIKELNQQLGQNSIMNIVDQFIPTKLPDGITRSDAKTIIKSNFEFGKDDSGDFVKRDGEIVKDEKTRSRVSIKDAVSNFVAERKWTVAGGGGGGDDDLGGGGTFSSAKEIRSMKDMNKFFEEKNINHLSQEAKGHISEAVKAAKEAKEDFDFNE